VQSVVHKHNIRYNTEYGTVYFAWAKSDVYLAKSTEGTVKLMKNNKKITAQLLRCGENAMLKCICA